MDSIDSILQIPEVNPQKSSSKSWEALRAGWPFTYDACVECFFDRATFGQIRVISIIIGSETTVVRASPAGYMLKAVTMFERACLERFPQVNLTRHALDLAASSEIRYQHMRQRTFEKPAAALTKCLLNLVVERPEKIVRKGGRA